MILNNLPDKLAVFLAVKRWIKKYDIMTTNNEILESMTFAQFLRGEIELDFWGESLRLVQKEIRRIKANRELRVNLNS